MAVWPELSCAALDRAYALAMSQPVLLLIHGYPFDRTLWGGVVSCLDQDISVLTPNLRGFGGQPIGTDAPSMECLAEDMKRLLDERQVGQAVVAGMSMGGYVALAFAERYPERLAGLALISSQVWADTDEARAGRRAMIERVRREGAGVAAQAVIPKLFAAGNSQNPEMIRFPTLGAQQAGIAGITWALEAMARRSDRGAVFRSLSVPVLVLHGLEDKFIPAERAREMAGLAVEARYVELPGAGHATPLEAPVAVAAALSDLVRHGRGQGQAG
jgi:3-oxoadipate enol-lactonase